MGRRPTVAEAFQELMGELSAAQAPPSLDARQLRRAYTRRVFAIHPDRARVLGRKPSELEDELKSVNLAYQVLLEQVTNPRRTAARDSSGSREARARSRGQDAATGAQERSQRASSGHHWRGRLPKRELPFGEYLYYAHHISWSSLVDALAWQKRQRPMVGELAREQGLLDGFAIAHIHQARGRHERFGACAVRLGYLSERELRSLLAHQFSSQDRIGHYFVRSGQLAAERVESFAHAHQQHNASVAGSSA
ncbi:MAG: J domain-containing protein [Myxococcota bacterium]